MGGRGSVSVSGGGKIHIGSLHGGKNDIRNVGGPADTRKDVNEMFQRAGFSSVEGLGDVPTAVLGAYAMQLQNLEREFGAIGAVKGVDGRSLPVRGMDSDVAIAAVSFDVTGTPVALLINRKMMGNITSMNAAQRDAEKDGWSMPTDGSTKSLARYSITHEYGHITEAALFKKSGGKHEGRDARTRANEITRSAQKRYGATQKDVSKYGRTNSEEFFAEAFANAKSGKPNAVGKAMNDYLKKHRL